MQGWKVSNVITIFIIFSIKCTISNILQLVSFTIMYLRFYYRFYADEHEIAKILMSGQLYFESPDISRTYKNDEFCIENLDDKLTVFMCFDSEKTFTFTYAICKLFLISKQLKLFHFKK